MKALAEHGPCPEHRRSFVNVGGVVRTRDATAAALAAADSQAAEEAAGGAEQVGDPSSLAASPCHGRTGRMALSLTSPGIMPGRRPASRRGRAVPDREGRR